MKRIVTAFCLAAAIMLPSASASREEPAPLAARTPVVQPALKLPPGNLYEADLARPVKKKAVHTVFGLSWTCAAATCTARGKAARPSADQCKALAERVGPLKYCGPARKRSVPAPGLRPSPGLMKPAPGAKIRPGAAQGIRTAPIVITGSPNLPPPHAPLGPVEIRTAPITVTGSPKLPPPREPHGPVTIRTDPIRITGDR